MHEHLIITLSLCEMRCSLSRLVRIRCSLHVALREWRDTCRLCRFMCIVRSNSLTRSASLSTPMRGAQRTGLVYCGYLCLSTNIHRCAGTVSTEVNQQRCYQSKMPGSPTHLRTYMHGNWAYLVHCSTHICT